MEFQRASGEQFSMLLEFMENHGDLARTRAGPLGPRLKADRLWVTLTESLNSVEHGVRTTTERWKRVWADWKWKTKKKLIAMKLNGNKVKFSNFEERLLALTDSSKVDKLADVKDQEVDNINSSADLEFNPVRPKIEISVEPVSSPVPPENSSIQSPVEMQQIATDPLTPSIPSNPTLRHRQLRGFRRRMFIPCERSASVEQRYLLVDEIHERNVARRLELEKIRERNETRRVELEEIRESTEARRLDLDEMREKTEARRVEIEEKRQMTEARRLEVEEMQMKAQTQLLHRFADIAEACVELYRRQLNGT